MSDDITDNISVEDILNLAKPIPSTPNDTDTKSLTPEEGVKEPPKKKPKSKKKDDETKNLLSKEQVAPPAIESNIGLPIESNIAPPIEPIDDFLSNPDFVDVSKLQELGINVADLKKLKDNGLNSLLSILYTTRKDLVSIKGLSDVKIDKITEAAKKIGGSSATFMTGTDFVKYRQGIRFRISTGSNNVNALLGGGIESCSITEIFGEFRCGKTQLCHTIAVLAQQDRGHGGNSGKVIYIDTENTFRADRIEQIASLRGLDPQTVLDNILYARAYNVDHLNSLISTASSRMCQERFSLVIVDSIIAPFRVDYSGRGELADRQQTLAKTMAKLQKMSEEFNVAILIVNQVMSDPGAGVCFMAMPPKPIGGHILAHFSTTRLALRKGRGEQRVMKIYDSPNLPEGDAVYEISSMGIIDSAD